MQISFFFFSCFIYFYGSLDTGQGHVTEKYLKLGMFTQVYIKDEKEDMQHIGLIFHLVQVTHHQRTSTCLAALLRMWKRLCEAFHVTRGSCIRCNILS